MDLAGQRVLVVGLGRSGLSVARLCAQRGARVRVTDARPPSALAEALAALPPEIGPEARELGGHRKQSFLDSDLIVLSPGVPPLAEVAAARAAGVAITGEIELAAGFVQAPVVAVTGTNGKSTTTTLAGAMLAATGRPTFVGGNLGTPLAEAVGTPAAGPDGHVVVEVSSFQLETAVRFAPRVGILLNISPDHLDRYDGIEAYAAAKARLFAAQRPDDFAVVNVDDDRVRAIAEQVPAQVVPLSTRRSLAGERRAAAGWVEGDQIRLRLPGAPAPESYPAQSPGLIGRHNTENALAAALAARLCGATAGQVRATLQSFRPLPHRMILVGERAGVAFYDDSKGTNVGAVVAALDGFPRPVVLIAGGRDKGGSYAPLAGALAQVGRAAVLIGEAAERMESALASRLPVRRAATLEEAVAVAAALAHPGDAVVLSPACASFDMFRNYEHRGQVFAAAVAALGPPGAGTTSTAGRGG
jgi:UDP-N-acetylmuramoylalanine--D-glutamate ligase